MAGWHHWLDGCESGSWWWTGRPGVLWFTGSQRVGHDWATELNWNSIQCTRLLWMMCCNFSLLPKFMTQFLNGNFFYITLGNQFQRQWFSLRFFHFTEFLLRKCNEKVFFACLFCVLGGGWFVFDNGKFVQRYGRRSNIMLPSQPFPSQLGSDHF